MRIFGKEEVIHPADPEEGSRSESIEERGIQILQDPIVPHGLQAGKKGNLFEIFRRFFPVHAAEDYEIRLIEIDPFRRAGKVVLVDLFRDISSSRELDHLIDETFLSGCDGRREGDQDQNGRTFFPRDSVRVPAQLFQLLFCLLNFQLSTGSAIQ